MGQQHEPTIVEDNGAWSTLSFWRLMTGSCGARSDARRWPKHRAPGSTLAEWSGKGDTERRWRTRLADVALNLVLTAHDKPVGMVSATAPTMDDARAAETRERSTFVARRRRCSGAHRWSGGPISVSTSASGLREMSGTRAFADG